MTNVKTCGKSKTTKNTKENLQKSVYQLNYLVQSLKEVF